ncbi:MAG: hypothetical protein M1300_07500 [Epsilonproteobacteria bacterium]|nr:hypothetical protein [Campylobacterota bacterium]
MKKLILSALFAIFSIVSADTINSVSKNPSMAVLGTQRDSATVINPYVIPIAVSGAACNSTTDIVAVTSDHSSQLICQSGSWNALGGGANITALYLQAYEPDPMPALCPSGWSQTDYRRVISGAGADNTRMCLPPVSKTCSVIYLSSYEVDPMPALCPSGWSQADYRRELGGNGANNTRSCYKCQ